MSSIQNDLDPDVYIGLELPMNYGSQGFFKRTKTALEQTKSNIRNLLNTQKGERLGNPNFGCDLRQVIFEQEGDVESQMKSGWRLTAPGQKEKIHGRHPPQKPLSLIERCLLASTQPGDSVLDPFAGSGSTGVAALSCGRNFLGSEIDPAYVNLAITRLTAPEQATQATQSTSC